jgi:two-component response regulator (ARR-B family)
MPDMDGFKLLEHIGLEMDLPVISQYSTPKFCLPASFRENKFHNMFYLFEYLFSKYQIAPICFHSDVH